MSETAKKLFESLKEAKESVLEAVPSFQRILPEVGAELGRQFAHGSSEIMSGIHTGSAFVMYGPGQNLPGVDLDAMQASEPTNVSTLRLWSASLSRSSRTTPGTVKMACTMASILAGSRPSEKLGTHSMSCLGI